VVTQEKDVKTKWEWRKKERLETTIRMRFDAMRGCAPVNDEHLLTFITNQNRRSFRFSPTSLRSAAYGLRHKHKTSYLVRGAGAGLGMAWGIKNKRPM
jgi:hypothetical protein